MADLKFQKIDPLRPAGEQIFSALKLAILRMELPPGQILSESDFAEQFGASRTPVREALMKLRDAGLVTTQPSRGHFVTLLQEDSIRSARFLREAIEVANVKRICEKPMPDSILIQLKDNLDQQTEAVSRHDEVVFSRLDDEFHRIIAQATGYDRVAAALEREKVYLDRLRVLTLRDQKHMGMLEAEHQEIFAALLARDTARAATAIRIHLRSVLNILSTLMSQHAEYFESKPQVDERSAT